MAKMEDLHWMQYSVPIYGVYTIGYTDSEIVYFTMLNKDNNYVSRDGNFESLITSSKGYPWLSIKGYDIYRASKAENSHGGFVELIEYLFEIDDPKLSAKSEISFFDRTEFINLSERNGYKKYITEIGSLCDVRNLKFQKQAELNKIFARRLCQLRALYKKL